MGPVLPTSTPPRYPVTVISRVVKDCALLFKAQPVNDAPIKLKAVLEEIETLSVVTVVVRRILT